MTTQRMLSKKQQALVIEGNEVKLRLQADRVQGASVVHIDWLRFTMQLRNAPVPSAETLFPSVANRCSDEEHWNNHYQRLTRILRELPDPDFAASSQAHALAQKICKILGPEFQIEPELKKGQDFYRFRWSITRNGAECAWVGFLASGDSPRQQAQSQTIHANLYGAACTFARGDWRVRMANLVEECDAKITRCDLALDFFNGIAGGLDRIRDDWHSGAMDVNGRRPKANTVGPWVEGGRGRSFYFGSKEAGRVRDEQGFLGHGRISNLVGLQRLVAGAFNFFTALALGPGLAGAVVVQQQLFRPKG